MNTLMRISTSIFVIAAVILGVSQVSNQNYLLGQEVLSLCCNNGFCDNGPQCSETSSIKSELLLGCDQDDFSKTCLECINLQSQKKVCGHFNPNAYCMLNGQRYYVCNTYSVDVAGPSQLNPGQWGTFFAELNGHPNPPYNYQWYKRVECLNDGFDSEDSSSTDDLPCGKWYSIGSNSSSVQAMGQWDFSLKVVVDANCYESSATSPVFYVNVGGSLAKCNEAGIGEQVHQNLPNLINDLTSYPNPFNANTSISFSLPETKRLSLGLYNIRGQLIKTLIADRELASGQHQITWNGRNERGEDVASGIYFCRIITQDSNKLIRLTLIK